MSESVHSFGENGSLIGVLTHPDFFNERLPIVIHLNAGILHRVGPSRITVKMSKAMSQLGFSSFRFDFSGIGDSISSKTMQSSLENAIQETRQAMDFLNAEFGFDNFIVIGLCTGAEVSVLTALQDERIIGVCGINGLYTRISNITRGPFPYSIKIRYYKKNFLNLKKWLSFIPRVPTLIRKCGEGLFLYLYGKAKKITSPVHAPKKNTKKVVSDEFTKMGGWDILIKKNISFLLVYSEGSNAWDFYRVMKNVDFRKLKGRSTFKLFKDVDHTFTPVWAQNALVTEISDWINSNFKSSPSNDI